MCRAEQSIFSFIPIKTYQVQSNLSSYLDSCYFGEGIVIPTMIISGLAQLFLRNAYGKWSQTRNTSGIAGPEVAQQIMRHAGLNVRLEMTPGELSDHYDPAAHTVRMSPAVAQTNSVAAMAIVAHELGHAQQHQDGSALIQARSFLLPAVQISPMLSYGLIFAGLIFNFTGLAWLGIAFFGVSVLFMILTLPVEIDASRRGLKLLQESAVMASTQDRDGARQVLTAAALTYVAAAITSILTLIYYISLVSNSRD